jgi:hypothetical protein
MAAPEYSWIALSGLTFVGALCGYGVRLALDAHADRASATRIATLCDQLDLKDRALQGLRAELRDEQARTRDLEGALAVKHAARAAKGGTTLSSELPPVGTNPQTEDDPALCLDGDADVPLFKRRVRASEARTANEPARAQRTG